ncbi:MAG: ATP-binding protein [Acidobacteriota bacterium]|nr:ATP-binding protein [Acidobacteriota bacterium]
MSLRSSVLFGAILWTTGLFALAGIALNFAIIRHPEAPIVFHATFRHGPPVMLFAIICMLVGLLQVRQGLSPINRLRDRLTGVRDGRERRLDGVYPAEVQPLVDDLNTLIEDRERRVNRAMAKAGDLAHGLKTPLAILANEARLIGIGAPGAAAIIEQQIDRMRRQIDYHLAHARASASGAAPAARASVAEIVDGLSRTLTRLHANAGRGLVMKDGINGDHFFRGQREDLEEMLGNVLDNAFKWARSRVVITSSIDAGALVIDVDDDGPGIPPEMREAVLQRGVKADEAAPGSGLGLAIVRDLAEIYGGSVTLMGSPLGGARARLRLPHAD